MDWDIMSWVSSSIEEPEEDLERGRGVETWGEERTRGAIERASPSTNSVLVSPLGSWDDSSLVSVQYLISCRVIVNRALSG